jgi:CRISPR-associated protein Cmr4
MNDTQTIHTFNTFERRLYIIIAKTNMHAGSGETSPGLVDNRVQRDVLSGLPNINASALKGALREYHSHIWEENQKKNDHIRYIFGSDSFTGKDKKPEDKNHQAGAFRFFNANLLSIPVRSNVRPYYHATSPEVLRELINTIETFDYPAPGKLKKSLTALLETYETMKKENKTKKLPARVFDGSKGVVLEDFNIPVENKEPGDIDLELLERLTGSPLALLSTGDFKEICSDYHLPLIARNNLENGRSKNLWHEQVVPRESRFYFCLLKPHKENKPDLEFRQDLPVQVGGNATIGYGFTVIKEAGQVLNHNG